MTEINTLFDAIQTVCGCCPRCNDFEGSGGECDTCNVRKLWDTRYAEWENNLHYGLPMISYTFEDIRSACDKDLTDEQCWTIVERWDYSDLAETVGIVAANYGFID